MEYKIVISPDMGALDYALNAPMSGDITTMCTLATMHYTT